MCVENISPVEFLHIVFGSYKIFSLQKFPELRCPTFQPSPAWHINCAGILPKDHTPSRWCLITNLSHPLATSVNDNSAASLYTLSHNTVLQLAVTLSRLVKNASLVKLDIQTTDHYWPCSGTQPYLWTRCSNLNCVHLRIVCGYCRQPRWVEFN